MSIRSVLVPLDGSPAGEHALPFALSVCRRSGAQLTLIHVHVPVTYYSSADIHLPMPPEEIQLARDMSQSYLDDAAARVRAVSSVELTSTLLEGFVTEELTEYMAENPTDLVVLTTHGRGPLSRMWLGSVANELVQSSTAPLFLIRPTDAPPDLTTDPIPNLKTILIPLDGSSFAEQSLPLAMKIGSLSGSVYRLFRAVPNVLSSSWFGSGTPPEGMQAATDKLVSEAEQYLQGLVAKTPELAAAQIQVANDWPPTGAILADAELNHADLIAMTTHGRGGLAKLFLGSVADKVLRGSSLPILLCRPPEDEA